jgi:ATP/maltotriose-dependent transcriptional regulator MalT
MIRGLLRCEQERVQTADEVGAFRRLDSGYGLTVRARTPRPRTRSPAARRSARTWWLSVSLNTVSAHLRSIYAKLQVRDRSAAVQRARELRLLAARRTR